MFKQKKILLIAILLFSIELIFAFQFEPIIQDFAPSGINSRRSFQVINSSDVPIAVKVSMVNRNVDLYGKEELTDASELFFVFPKQFVVPAQSTQAVRVQWLGKEYTDIELPFRIIAEQLPVNVNRDESGVTILLAYHGSVYVVPEEFRFGIRVNDVYKGTDKDGNEALLIELENTGNTHMILEDPVITLTKKTLLGGGDTIALEGEELAGLINQNILAGKRRVFTVPWPERLTFGELDATISLEPNR